MKHQCFFFYVLYLSAIHSVQLQSQSLEGVVRDATTKEPVDYAEVYFNGTFVGTTTDEQGCFSLDIKDYAKRPLYISAMGYRTAILENPLVGQRHEIFLVQSVFEIKELSVSAKSLERRRKANLKVFRREFLGQTSNAHQCRILNEEDLTFNYQNDRDTLRAFARKPLRILNEGLGYYMTYYLDRFEYIRYEGTVIFRGQIVFNQDLAQDPQSIIRYVRRRKNTYTGSCNHFFRSLWNDSYQSAGFRVQLPGNEKLLSYDEIVRQDASGTKYLSYGADLEISYNHYASTVRFLKKQVRFEKDGYFDPEALLWLGSMARSRIADWLPLEYRLPY